MQRVNCANTEGLFRIIQSIPSPRAEPFKRWLAQVGKEYSILTAEIARATFGVTPGAHSRLNNQQSRHRWKMPLTSRLPQYARLEVK